MLAAADAYCTSVGKKGVMAVSGAALFLFLIGHLLGNIQIFFGPEHLNNYAAFLKSTGEILWLLRIGTAACAALHVVTSVQITIANLKARPEPYACKRNIETTVAARTMIYTGAMVGLYIAYHLMMFTFLTTGPGYSDTDVYRNVVLSFQVPAIAAVYVAAMALLGMHLWHAAWSMTHTLGLSAPGYHPLRRIVGPAVAVAVTVGYISIPLAILLGVVR
jgi:succinate dehydrogenase / fumarate reductase cytochrome b subunit